MVLTNCYCTVSQLKRSLKRPNSDGLIYDSLFEECITRASRNIDKYCNRIFYSKTITNELFDRYEYSENGLVVDKSGTKLLIPGTIISISSIYNNNTLLTEYTDYVLYKKAGYIYKASGWSADRVTTTTGIKLTMTYGESTTPSEIENICIELAKVYTGLDTRMVVGQNGDFQVEMGNKIPPHIKKSLDFWRRWSV